MQCSPSFFIWNWKRQIGNRTFTVQVPGDLRDMPIVYPCWADQPQRSSVIKNLRDDNLAGWYSHINHRKQNTIEFHSWWWWEGEGVDLYFVLVMSMLEFLWSMMLDLFIGLVCGWALCGALLLYGFSLLDVNQGQEEFGSMKQLSILSLCPCYDLTICVYHEVC